MTVGSIEHDRKWRRTAVVRNCRLVPLPNDWSLFDPQSGFEIARIFAEDDLGGGWRCIIRKIRDGELVDSFSGWRETGKEAREFCETQTVGERYILPHKPQINVQQITDNSYVTSARESGHIYILSNPTMPGLLKIGYTDRTPEDRARELHTTATPAPFVVEFAVKLLGNTFEIEQGIHNHMQQYRFDKKREFFRINLREAAQIIAGFLIDKKYTIVGIYGNIPDPFPEAHEKAERWSRINDALRARQLQHEAAMRKRREWEEKDRIERENAKWEAEKPLREAARLAELKNDYMKWRDENSKITIWDLFASVGLSIFPIPLGGIGSILFTLIAEKAGYIYMAQDGYGNNHVKGPTDACNLMGWITAILIILYFIVKDKRLSNWGKIVPEKYKEVAGE